MHNDEELELLADFAPAVSQDDPFKKTRGNDRFLNSGQLIFKYVFLNYSNLNAY